jgi:hypothetical protein
MGTRDKGKMLRGVAQKCSLNATKHSFVFPAIKELELTKPRIFPKWGVPWHFPPIS